MIGRVDIEGSKATSNINKVETTGNAKLCELSQTFCLSAMLPRCQIQSRNQLIKAFNRPSFASFSLFRRTIVLKDWKLLPTMSTKFTCGWVIVLPFLASFNCSNATQPFFRLACHEEVFLLVVRSPVQSAKRTIKDVSCLRLLALLHTLGNADVHSDNRGSPRP